MSQPHGQARGFDAQEARQLPEGQQRPEDGRPDQGTYARQHPGQEGEERRGQEGEASIGPANSPKVQDAKPGQQTGTGAVRTQLSQQRVGRRGHDSGEVEQPALPGHHHVLVTPKKELFVSDKAQKLYAKISRLGYTLTTVMIYLSTTSRTMESIPDYLIGNMVQVYGWQSKEGLWDTISIYPETNEHYQHVDEWCYVFHQPEHMHSWVTDQDGEVIKLDRKEQHYLANYISHLQPSSTGQEGEQVGTSTWRFARLGHRLGLQSCGPQTGVSGPHQTIETSLGSPEPTMYGVQSATSPHELQAQSERCSARRSRRTSPCGTCSPYRMDSGLRWKRLLV